MDKYLKALQEPDQLDKYQFHYNPKTTPVGHIRPRLITSNSQTRPIGPSTVITLHYPRPLSTKTTQDASRRFHVMLQEERDPPPSRRISECNGGGSRDELVGGGWWCVLPRPLTPSRSPQVTGRPTGGFWGLNLYVQIDDVKRINWEDMVECVLIGLCGGFRRSKDLF
ncbi:hypothetical protein WA026_004196 [Henosepilachna vigintioctopunctata]|uniref:Uncharacterized protein n=1 Tax=Henosepilachna vigintioctopunctata TaxID=420089 RepID=A0AAW1UEA2_9CUCU